MSRENAHLYNCNDLVPYGIHPLTGEACAYSRRILCDLSQEGVILMTAYLGLSCTVEAARAFPANRNAYVGVQPAVAGVMVARAAFPDLMIFTLLHVGQYDYVLETPDGGFTGFNDGDRYAQHYLKDSTNGTLPNGYRLHHNCAKRSTQPHIGDRNIHAMSGRVL